MWWMYNYGSKEKSGYGYDWGNKHIHPFECNPQNITRNLGSFLRDESLNYINLLSKYDNDEYYLIQSMLEIKSGIKFGGCDKSPENIPGQICEVAYGIDIQFCIEKNKFLNKNHDEIKQLLESVYNKKDYSELTSEELETKCEVLINFEEKRKMTLKEIFEFFCDQQNIQKYQSTIQLDALSNPNYNENSIKIKNKDELASLMYNLYIFYQKFENIYDIQVERPNIDEIKIQLEKSKNEFRNVDENDFIGMYKTTKKLFKCYQVYLDHMFENKLNVDDEDKKKYKEWIQKLKLSIQNVNIVLIRCLKMNNLINLKYCQKMEKIFEKIDYPYIFEFKFETLNQESIKNEILKTTEELDLIPKEDYIQAYQISKKMYHLLSMHSSLLMKNDNIIKNSDELRQFLTDKNEKCEFWKENLKKLLKNIDSIEQAKPLNSFSLKPKNSNDLIRKCPSIICNDNDEFRRWKCSICDGFMKIETVECDCGYKQFEDLNFYCEYYSRQ